MAFTLPTSIPLGSKSRARHPSIHPGFDELNNYNDSGNRRRNHDNNLWVSIKQVEWGEYNPYIRFIRRYSRFRFGIHSPHSWRSLFTRNSDKSSQSGTRSNRDRPRNRHYFYYGIIISILAVAPVSANEGETNNTSNPVAAATGNVTNQAVQFQNNGAPSRQVYGPNISCNGSTMTFSPFYMGNHTKPWDIDEDGMRPSSYTMAENWGGQINFMIPLDREGLKRCRSIAAQQHEKMKLNYELVRIDNCAKLQQKGFMLLPGSRVYHLCSDVIPISAWKQAQAKVLKCKSPPKPWYKPWQKPKETCKMSSLTLQRKDTTPNLDGPNDLQPAPKTSIIIEKEAKVVVETPKKTTPKK
jgi:hypothetical protein